LCDEIEMKATLIALGALAAAVLVAPGASAQDANLTERLGPQSRE
jgi:hypothetical protein